MQNVGSAAPKLNHLSLNVQFPARQPGATSPRSTHSAPVLTTSSMKERCISKTLSGQDKTLFRQSNVLILVGSQWWKDMEERRLSKELNGDVFFRAQPLIHARDPNGKSDLRTGPP